MTCKVHIDDSDYSDKPMIMTAAHWPQPSCGSFVGGEVGHQDNKVGMFEEDYTDLDYDFSLIDVYDNAEIDSITNEVKRTDSVMWDIEGHITENGFDILIGSPINNYGMRTSLTSGDLLGKYDFNGHCDDSSPIDFFLSEACSYSGDSGAPHYYQWQDDAGCTHATVLGIHLGSPDGFRAQSIGCLAYEIADYPSGSGNVIKFGKEWEGTCEGDPCVEPCFDP